MKTIFLMLISVFTFNMSYGQDSIQTIQSKSGLITLSPKKNLQKNTNGINLGILDSYEHHQKINGINLQANPYFIIYPLIPKAIEGPAKEEATVTVNGIHISTSGMFDGKNLNGLGISAYHHAYETNGISVNVYNNTSINLNGLHISGFANSSDKGRGVHIAIMGNYSENFQGLMIGAFNESPEIKGLHIGIFNKADKMKGLQIGLINKNTSGRNFQIGFWNKNAKRTLPIINF